jgi:CBS domain-containing membrane protein
MAGEEYHGFHKRLVDHFGTTRGEATYTFIACLIALAVSGMAAYLFSQPLLFPSLGPTAFLFFEQSMAKTSSPRSTLIGHLVPILAGAVSLAVFGLLGHPSILVEGVTLARVGAGALSVALTGAVLLLLRSSHPPTGATTLIVSLGLLQTALEMTMLMVGIVILTVVGWAINRALGVPMPIWAAQG